jgi:hypothetical protein
MNSIAVRNLDLVDDKRVLGLHHGYHERLSWESRRLLHSGGLLEGDGDVFIYSGTYLGHPVVALGWVGCSKLVGSSSG